MKEIHQHKLPTYPRDSLRNVSMINLSNEISFKEKYESDSLIISFHILPDVWPFLSLLHLKLHLKIFPMKCGTPTSDGRIKRFDLWKIALKWTLQKMVRTMGPMCPGRNEEREGERTSMGGMISLVYFLWVPLVYLLGYIPLIPFKFE